MALSTSFLSSYYSSMYNSYSNFFNNSNNLFNASNNSSNLTSIVEKYTYFKSNYAEIKKSLLDMDSSKDGIELEDSNSQKLEGTSQVSQFLKTKLSAGELKDSLDELSNDKLYVKNEDGTYNTDKIKTALNDFIDSYNDLKNLAGESTNDTVVKKAYYMVNTTSTFEKTLDSIGIDVKSDNTLSLNEKAFEKVDISKVQTLFDSEFSYGAMIENRATEIKGVPMSGYLTYSFDSNKNSFVESYLSSMSNTSIIDYFV